MCCGALGEEGGGVVGPPGGRVQEGVVGCVEGREIREGGEVTFQLGGIAVDSCCQLCEVEDIQGTVLCY